MSPGFDLFRFAILDLIALRRNRVDAMALPDPDLDAVEDLEVMYLDLVDTTTPAEQEAIGEFYREALEQLRYIRERYAGRGWQVQLGPRSGSGLAAR